MIASCHAYTLPVATSVRTMKSAFGVVTLTDMALRWESVASPATTKPTQLINRIAAGNPPFTLIRPFPIHQVPDILSAS